MSLRAGSCAGKSGGRVASGVKDGQWREKLQGVARGGCKVVGKELLQRTSKWYSQHPGPPPAHGVTLALEAQTSEGNVVSKILLSYYMCLL